MTTVDNHGLRNLLAGAVAPLFWLLFWATLLWLTRKLFPRSERYLWGPLYNFGWLIGNTLRRLRRVIRRLAS